MGSAAAPGGCVCVCMTREPLVRTQRATYFSSLCGRLLMGLSTSYTHQWRTVKKNLFNDSWTKRLLCLGLSSNCFFFKEFFLMWTFFFFKSIIEFVTILLLFCFWGFWPQGMWGLSSPGLETVPLALEEVLTTGPVKSLCQLWLVSIVCCFCLFVFKIVWGQRKF